MQPIIQKLEKNQPLNPEEKDLIRLWIVGEAEAFTQKEQDYQGWLEQFRQVGAALRDRETLPPSLRKC